MHLKFKTYTILEDAIARGLQYGWTKSHKHTETPDEELIIDEMSKAIMLELQDVIEFNEGDEE